jgi:dTMP kinase
VTAAPGHFVTLDGVGGAGKTTTAHLVVDILSRQGLGALYSREPSDSVIGQFVREQFGAISGHALAALVAADRFDHLATVISPARRAGTIVVCDRYVASSLVLQALDGVPEAYIEELNAPAPQPDLAVLLTADPDTAWARVSQRGSHGRSEESPQQSAAEHAAYQRIGARLQARGWNVATLDTASAGPAEVAEAVVSLINGLATSDQR